MSAPTAPVPPQNLEAEESVLGAMLLSTKAIQAVSAELNGGSEFYRASHAKIYRAIVALHAKGEPVDAITIVDELEKRGQLDEVGGRGRVFELAALVPATANAGHYARIVKEMATLSSLVRAGQEIIRLGIERPGETAELVEQARKIISEIASSCEPGGLASTRLSEIEMRSIVFLEKPLWQASAFQLVVGRKGVGKGTMLSDLAARFTRGEMGAKDQVVWIATEDSMAVDVKPRLVAAGGRPEHVAVITDWIQLPRDISKLSNTIAGIGNVGLVIIDPIGNHITGKNSNSETDIRDAIAPLNDLADKHETLIAGIRHLSEKECGAGALAAILGSSAWVQVPRAVIAIVRDEDTGLSHIQCLAGNRLPPGTPGRQFRIEGVLLDGLEHEIAHAVWNGDSTADVEALLQHRQPQGAKRASARELILDTLRDGPRQLADLKTLAAAELGVSGDTVWRAANEMKTEGLVRCGNSGPGTSWLWQLCETAHVTSASRPANPHGSKTSPYTTNAEVNRELQESESGTADFLTSAGVRASAEVTVTDDELNRLEELEEQMFGDQP